MAIERLNIFVLNEFVNSQLFSVLQIVEIPSRLSVPLDLIVIGRLRHLYGQFAIPIKIIMFTSTQTLQPEL